MINDKTSSLLDLLNMVVFPSEDRNTEYYYSFKNKMQNLKYIYTLIKHSANDNYFTFEKADNTNFSISWQPNAESLTNALKEYREWQKPFQFSNNQYFYFDYRTDSFNFDKKPNILLTENEINDITRYTHQMDIDFKVKDAIISLFDMKYEMLRTEYKDGWNIEFKFTANSTNEPQKALEPIVMPDNKNVINFDTIYQLMFFPYGGKNNNLLETFDNYTFSSARYSYE